MYAPPKQNKKIEIPSLKSVDSLLKKKDKNNAILEAKEEAITTYISQPSPNNSYEIQTTQIKRTRDTFFKNYKIIGQIFNTYWIIEQSKSIFIIDQHAAHERILYEELITQLKQKKVTAQMLLQPLLLRLTEKEKDILQQNRELLNQFGFSIEKLEAESYALLSVPFIIKAPTNTKFFLDILDLLEEVTIENVYDTKVLTIATMACKAAVKANDKLSITEATAMIEKLLQLENPFTCPHGRPTIIEMTQYELEKRFKRIQN